MPFSRNAVRGPIELRKHGRGNSRISPIPPITDIVIATVYFLISLLFFISACDPYPLCFPSSLYLLLGNVDGGVSEQNTIWAVLLRTLNWGISFLSHDRRQIAIFE